MSGEIMLSQSYKVRQYFHAETPTGLLHISKISPEYSHLHPHKRKHSRLDGTFGLLNNSRKYY